MKTLLRYFRKYWFLAALASIFMVGEVSIDLLQPRLMETIMDQGAIIETGTHEELLEKKGSYYKLYMTQFAGNAT